MKRNKYLALVLATTMVIGGSITVLAADTGSVTGEGETLPHVSKKVTSVTLPVVSAVSDVFNYKVDPEGLINAASTLADGTAVAGNTDGVYFHNSPKAASDGALTYTSGGVAKEYTVTGVSKAANITYTYNGTDSKWEDENGDEVTGIGVKKIDDTDPTAMVAVTPSDGDTITVSGAVSRTEDYTYSSSSDVVTFTGRNSVDVAVSVAVTVDDTNSSTDIALVADQDALDAATTPALLLTLKVGANEASITADGAEAAATIAGVPENFEVKAVGGEFRYQAKSNASGWNSTTLQLSGKTNNKNVTSGMTAPKLTLTWTVTTPTPAASLVGTYSRANTANKITLSNLGDLTVSGLKTYMDDGTETGSQPTNDMWSVNATNTEITINGSTFVFGEGALGKERGIGVVLSDGTEIKITVTVNN
mgnify:CR=1 FL=1